MAVLALSYLLACHAGIFYITSLATDRVRAGEPGIGYLFVVMLHIFVLTYGISLGTAHFWGTGFDKYCGLFSASQIEIMANTLQSILLVIMPVLGLVT